MSRKKILAVASSKPLSQTIFPSTYSRTGNANEKKDVTDNWENIPGMQNVMGHQ